LTIAPARRTPIPDNQPIGEARQLAVWLRHTGHADPDIMDRLDQALDDIGRRLDALIDENEDQEERIDHLEDKVHSLRDKIDDARDQMTEILGDLDYELDHDECYRDDGTRIEGERHPAGVNGRHPTINLRSPWQEMIPIDEDMAPIITFLWRQQIKTYACCQESQDGTAFISFDHDARAEVELLIPAAADWQWITTDAVDDLVYIPRSELFLFAAEQLLDNAATDTP
jgi:hypothetical protein